MPILHRLKRQESERVAFLLDGVPREGRRGDTLLTAILGIGERLRSADFSGEPRAGFCQMGACQDCWVWLDAGERVRACTTPLAAGMHVSTSRGDAS